MADIPTPVRNAARRVNIPENLHHNFNRPVGDDTIGKRCERLLKAVYQMPRFHRPMVNWGDARHVWAMGGEDPERDPLLLMDEIMACFSAMTRQAEELKIVEVLRVPNEGYESWKRCCALLRAYVDCRDGGDTRLREEASQSRSGNREMDMIEFLDRMRLYSAQNFM